MPTKAFTNLVLFPQPELTSTPNFVVEVTKDGSKKALVLDCHYPEDEVGRVECQSPLASLGASGDLPGPICS